MALYIFRQLALLRYPLSAQRISLNEIHERTVIHHDDRAFLNKSGGAITDIFAIIDSDKIKSLEILIPIAVPLKYNSVFTWTCEHKII